MRFALLLLPLISSLALAEDFRTEPSKQTLAELTQLPARVDSDQTLILEIRSDVKCTADGSGRLRAVTGSLSLGGNNYRFDLFENKPVTEIPLGNDVARANVAILTINGSPNCSLRKLEARGVVEDLRLEAGAGNHIEKLALLHAPVVKVRVSLKETRDSDIPLLLAYSRMPQTDGSVILRYTIFYSDEDSLKTVSALAGQMGRYGRCSDIEWIYEVKLDANHQVVERLFHGGLFKNATMGHGRHRFSGALLDNTHAVLYNVGNNNIFADKGDATLDGYALVPRTDIPAPHCRESALFENTWMFRASDDETIREKKSPGVASSYLYVLIDGSPARPPGFLARAIILDGDKKVAEGVSGDGRTLIDRLGEDLFERQAYTAIPFNPDVLSRIGDLHVELAFSVGEPRLKLNAAPRVFRLVRKDGEIRPEEVTSAVKFMNGAGPALP